MAIPNIVLVGW